MKKALRIKKTSEIEAVMKARDVVRNKHFKIFKKENHDKRHFRIAFSVPKRYGNAVERNIMKRRLRMIVSNVDIDSRYDVFIVVDPKSKELSFETLKESLRYLLQKGQIIRGEKK